MSLGGGIPSASRRSPHPLARLERAGPCQLERLRFSREARERKDAADAADAHAHAQGCAQGAIRGGVEEKEGTGSGAAGGVLPPPAFVGAMSEAALLAAVERAVGAAAAMSAQASGGEE